MCVLSDPLYVGLVKICVIASALFCAPCSLIRSIVPVDFFLDIMYGEKVEKKDLTRSHAHPDKIRPRILAI